LLGPPVFVPSGLDDPEQNLALTIIRGMLQVVLEAAYFGEDRQSAIPADTAGRTGHRAAAIDDGSRHPSTPWPPGGLGYDSQVIPAVVPQLVANDGTRALRHAIADPERFACEPKVDGVRGLVVYQPERILEMRNRRGEKRDWLRGDAFERGLRRLADRLPNPWEGTVLDGEVTAARFEGTMWALLGSKRFRLSLRFVVFDVPVLIGTDIRGLAWQERRERLEPLVSAFDVPIELSPLLEPSVSLVEQMTVGRLDGIAQRTAPRAAATGRALGGRRSRTLLVRERGMALRSTVTSP
jgi:hypothetical protein